MVAALPSNGSGLITLKFTLLPALLAAEDNDASLALQNDFLLGNDGGGYSRGIFGSALRVASPAAAADAVRLRQLQVAAKAGSACGTPRWSLNSALASASALVGSSPARQQHGSLNPAYLLS